MGDFAGANDISTNFGYRYNINDVSITPACSTAQPGKPARERPRTTHPPR